MIKIEESNKKETIYIENNKGWGEIPTLETIKRNLIELWDICKDCKTYEDIERVGKQLNTEMEINGTPISYGYDEEPIEWFRVEYYKWLDFIYFNFDESGNIKKGSLYFDVRDSNYEDFLIDVLPKRLDDEYNQFVSELKVK